jgi:hypothetical protein
MTDGSNSEFLEIVGREMEQYASADAILPERRLVTFKTRVTQPASNIHRRLLRLGDARGRVLPR